MSQTLIVPFNGQEIGQGFNSETRENVGTGLSVNSISEDKFADGQRVTTSFQIITDQTSLMESLGVSASVDARYMLFSGGAKVAFAESHAVNSFSSFIAGRCLVENAQRDGHQFAVLDPALLTRPGGIEDFKTAFGDMFVRALNTGGEFLVVARITSTSESHQRTLTSSLHGEYNGLAVAVSFNVALQTAMNDASSHTEVTVWMSQSGGQGLQAAFTGPDATKILKRLEEFPASVLQHPVGYEAELATYNTIPIPVPTREESEDQALVVADCAQQKAGYLKVMSDLDLAFSPDGKIFFDQPPPPSELIRVKDLYRAALNALMRHAILVATGRMNPPQMFVANPPPPAIALSKKIQTSSPPPPPPPPLFVSIPFWINSSQLEPDAPAGPPTPRQLGIKVRLLIHLQTIVPQPGPFGLQVLPDIGKITSIDPAPGNSVARGTTVTIHSIGRRFNEPDGTVIERLFE